MEHYKGRQLRTGKIPGLGTFAEYREVFFQRPTPRFVVRLFEGLPLAETLTEISRIALILHNNALLAHQPELQLEMFAAHQYEVSWLKLLRELMVRENRVLVHEVQMGLMARLALLHCYTDERLSDRFADDFVRALLAVNELYGKTHHLHGVAEGKEAFVALEVQQIITDDEAITHLLARNDRFFEWVGKLSVDDPDWLPVSDDLKRFIGLDYRDYVSASYAISMQFLTIKNATDAAQQGVAKSFKSICSSLSDTSKLEIWLSRCSASIDEMRDRLGRTETTFRTADLIAFLDRPILIAEDDLLFCPVPTFVSNQVGSGLYFTLHDYYKAEDFQKQRRFRGLYGRFLEQYCRELVAFATSGSNVTISGDELYNSPNGERRATDIIVTDGSETAVFIEVSKKRFKLMDTAVKNDFPGLEEDLKQMIVEKVSQIGDVLRDAEAGRFVLPAGVARVLPLVITGQAVPGLLGVSGMVRTMIEEAQPFRNTGISVEGVTWMSVDELESLALSFAPELDLKTFLTGKLNHADPAARANSIRNYLVFFCQESRRRAGETLPFLPGSQDFVQRVIIPTLGSWGMPTDQSPGLSTGS